MGDEGNLTDEMYTVGQLIEDLSEFPKDMLVMIAVCKYPAEFGFKPDFDGTPRWDLGSDVEVHPLDHGEVSMQQNQVWLAVELHEYNAERAMLNGSQAGAE